MSNPNLFKPVCFISYSSSDAEVAQYLAYQLKARGIEPWFDRRDLHLSQPVKQELRLAIARAHAFIVLLSQTSIGSEWVEFEMRSAMEEWHARPDYRVIALSLDGTESPEILGGILAAKWEQNSAALMDRILGTVALNPRYTPASAQLPLSRNAWHPQQIGGRQVFPVYIYALDPPISALGIDRAGERARLWAEAYGEAMLKLALLIGANPVISENQVYDSVVVLKLALDPDFRRLISEGHIILSYRKDPTFQTALATYASNEKAITSAWNVERQELLDVLKSETEREHEGVFGAHLAALRELDAIPRLVGAAAKPVSTLLEPRILNFVNYPPAFLRDQDVTPILQRFVRAVHNALREDQRNNRSAWIELVLNPEFVDKTLGQVHPAVLGDAVTLALVAYQEVVCESVAFKNALRSVAAVPVAFDDVVLRNSETPLLMKNFELGGLLSIVPPEQSGAILAIDDILAPAMEHIRQIGLISWTEIREVITDRDFSHYVGLIGDSREGTIAYLTWLDEVLKRLMPDRDDGRQGVGALGAILGPAQGQFPIDTRVSLAGLDRNDLLPLSMPSSTAEQCTFDFTAEMFRQKDKRE